MRKRVAAGEAADVFVVPPAVMDEFQKQGKIAAESRGFVGRSRMGVVVHASASPPDLSSTAAFRKALQGASAVVLEMETYGGEVKAAIDSMEPSGGTATGDAIATATSALRRTATPGERPPPAAILLLSDGKSTSGRDASAAARAAARLKVPVYTVVLGTEQGTITVPRDGGGTATRNVPPDTESLAEIARVSGGKAYTAETATGLKEIYESLGSQLGHENQKREITSAVTGGGLALMLVGVAMSLRWFGRLI